MGVGEARGDALAGKPTLRIKDLGSSNLKTLMADVMDSKFEDAADLGRSLNYGNYEDLAAFYSLFARIVRPLDTKVAIHLVNSPIIFEGHQGVLLDETYGLEPHRTWTDCTFGNVDLIVDGLDVEVEKVGVVRTYMTRHGAGPLPTEDISVQVPEAHNVKHPYMGQFRQGFLDLALVEYAVQCCGGIDSIAVTHMDTCHTDKLCIGRESGGIWNGKPKYIIHPGNYSGLENLAPKVYYSHGPTWKDKRILHDLRISA